jgi:hypothetical protein
MKAKPEPTAPLAPDITITPARRQVSLRGILQTATIHHPKDHFLAVDTCSSRDIATTIPVGITRDDLVKNENKTFKMCNSLSLFYLSLLGSCLSGPLFE